MSRSLKTIASVLHEAEERLEDARLGLLHMIEGRGRSKSGFRIAVTHARQVTFALQNLRALVPGFDDWYEPKKAEMQADKRMKFFADMRTTIEKSAHTPTSVSTHIIHFDSSRSWEQLGPAPKGAISFFMGDHTGGNGWVVRDPDGTERKVYIDLPSAIGRSELMIPEMGESTAIELIQEYLAKLSALVDDARNRFGRQQ